MVEYFRYDIISKRSALILMLLFKKLFENVYFCAYIDAVSTANCNNLRIKINLIINKYNKKQDINLTMYYMIFGLIDAV